jgi:hypothetical protein
MRAMRMSFPVLASLRLHSQDRSALVLHVSFLGGFAPRLLSFSLSGIPFPAIPKLLLSARYLVFLDLRDIPQSGYISPEVMVHCLSVSTWLRYLRLEFRSPQSPVDRDNRLLPRPTRVVLPTITFLWFKGDSEYLEDIVGQIDTPLLSRISVGFFNDRLTHSAPLLHDFLGRTETSKAPYKACLTVFDDGVRVDLFQRDGMVRSPCHRGTFQAHQQISIATFTHFGNSATHCLPSPL